MSDHQTEPSIRNYVEWRNSAEGQEAMDEAASDLTAPDHEQAERIDFDAARHTANVWARGEVGLPAETNLARAYLTLAAQLAERERALREVFRPEPYTGVRDPRCRVCQGRTWVGPRNHDDPKANPCIACDSTGLGPDLRDALAATHSDSEVSE